MIDWRHFQPDRIKLSSIWQHEAVSKTVEFWLILKRNKLMTILDSDMRLAETELVSHLISLHFIIKSEQNMFSVYFVCFESVFIFTIECLLSICRLLDLISISFGIRKASQSIFDHLWTDRMHIFGKYIQSIEMQ